MSSPLPALLLLSSLLPWSMSLLPLLSVCRCRLLAVVVVALAVVVVIVVAVVIVVVVVVVVVVAAAAVVVVMSSSLPISVSYPNRWLFVIWPYTHINALTQLHNDTHLLYMHMRIYTYTQRHLYI